MSADTDKDTDKVAEALLDAGWVPGSVAMNALDRMQSSLAAAEARAAEAEAARDEHEAAATEFCAAADKAETQRDALAAEVERLRRKVPRCKGHTDAGYRCAQAAGHPGTHSHPSDAAFAAVTPTEATA